MSDVITEYKKWKQLSTIGLFLSNFPRGAPLLTPFSGRPAFFIPTEDRIPRTVLAPADSEVR
jgi:hypothetical protein